MRFNRIAVAILTAITLILPVTSAEGRLKVVLGGAKFRPYQLAVPDFKAKVMSEDLLLIGRKLGRILRNDVGLTGSIRVISPRAYLEKPPKNGIEPGTFEMKPWTAVGAEGLLKGEVSAISTKKISVSYRFYEVATGKLALKDTITFKKKDLRWYTHVIADRVYRFLTGEPSIFTTKISCVRSYMGKREIYVMDFDGNNMVKLTNNGSINVLPAWSPDGLFLAYTSWKAGNPDLFVHRLSSGKLKKVSRYKGLNTGAAWSPNGKKIAFSSSRGRSGMHIWVVGRDGTGLRRVTKTKGSIRNLSPTWSPSGKQIAFVSTRSGGPQIYVMNADGSKPRRLTFQGNYNQAPKWSPKGDWILFTGRDERNVFDLFKINPKTGKVKRLTQNQGNNLEADWAPNGRNIVVSSTRAGVAKLFIMTSEGKNAKQITFVSGEFSTPSWSPSFGR